MKLAAAPPPHLGDSISFLSFRLDRRGGRLMRAGTTIPLRPKTWAVLLHLAERPGSLISKEELLDAVWPGVAVTPDTLTKSIGELRVALSDDSRMPRCIETVHRRGFRFIAKTGNGAVPGGTQPEWSAPALRTRLFVGRAGELRYLRSLYAQACAGQRQVVFITGPTGVGKTTLLEAFLESPSVHEAGSTVWIGRGCCVDQHGPREPFMPVLEALERLLHRPDAAPLLKLFRRTAPNWLAQIPWLNGNEAEVSRRADRPERMLREVSAATEAFTAGTLVLVLEDLHWSDPSTIDLLAVLGQRREPARLLVIGTYRPADVVVNEHVVAAAVRTLKVRQQCVELPVHDLTREDVCSYLEARFPEAQFPPTLARMLHDHTDGNPLFMVTVVDHMVSRGFIRDTAPGWVLSSPPEKLDLGVPEDVRGLIEVQLHGLSPAERALLEAASVGGVAIPVHAIAAALACDPGTAEMQCEALARAQRILHATGSTEWPGAGVTGCYGFTHELYRQAVYADIPEARRQRLQERLGAALAAAASARRRNAKPMPAPTPNGSRRRHISQRTRRRIPATGA